MKLLIAPGSEHLAKSIPDKIRIEYEYRCFPDGESYFRIRDSVASQLHGKSVGLVSTLFPDQNHRLVEFTMLASLLRDLGADQICGIIPYLAYSRADRRVLTGELLSHRYVVQDVLFSVADRLVTLHVHNPEAFKTLAGDKGVNVSAAGIIAGHARDAGLSGAVVVSPDQGQCQFANEIATALHGHSHCFNKIRDPVDGTVSVSAVDLDCKGMSVLLVDDIVSSGSSLVQAIRLIKTQKPSEIHVACAHGLFVNDPNAEKLRSHGVTSIISTNSVNSQFAVVDCMKALLPVVSSNRE